MMQGLTWTCHVCGDERPDALISVYKSVLEFHKVTLDQNVRYCNEREACRLGAADVSFLPKDI